MAKRRPGKAGTPSATRTVAGVLVALLGVGGAASLMLGAKKPQPAGKPATGTAPAAGVGGPALTTDGRVVSVGMVSSIPQAQGYDTGPLDYTYNPAGWDTARLGGRYG